MDNKLLEILACPACKSGLQYLQQQQELVCIPCRLAYTVRDDIPIMLIDQARKMSSDETDSLRK